VALFVVAIYLDVHVVGFYALFSACFVEPNGRDSLVQLPFGVIVLVNVSCLFGIDEF
jgi:hypothetical protein